MEILAMIRQAFWEESMSCSGKSRIAKTEKAETGEEQSQENAHYFL
jgi:hypothetical protein